MSATNIPSEVPLSGSITLTGFVDHANPNQLISVFLCCGNDRSNSFAVASSLTPGSSFNVTFWVSDLHLPTGRCNLTVYAKDSTGAVSSLWSFSTTIFSSVARGLHANTLGTPPLDLRVEPFIGRPFDIWGSPDVQIALTGFQVLLMVDNSLYELMNMDPLTALGVKIIPFIQSVSATTVLIGFKLVNEKLVHADIGLAVHFDVFSTIMTLLTYMISTALVSRFGRRVSV
jgi:hypothetical protein